jgi:hypothetical protein
MRSRIVCVDDVGLPFRGDGAELARRSNVPLTAERQPISGKASMLRSLDERRAGGGDDENSIAEVAQPGRQQKYLTLAATPAAPGVDVKNPGKFH